MSERVLNIRRWTQAKPRLKQPYVTMGNKSDMHKEWSFPFKIYLEHGVIFGAVTLSYLDSVDL